MNALTREAPAKINLSLRITGLRPDGYHEIESLVCRAELHDTISVSPRHDGRWTIDCDDPTIPCDGTNLAMKALHALSAHAGVSRGVHVQIHKRIPVGAGLGGGSSDAATTLMLVNELWNFGMPSAELAQVGRQVGSDVPLFLHGPVCIVRGAGEQIEPVETPFAAWSVLVIPHLRCDTARVYAAFDRLAARPGARKDVRTLVRRLTRLDELLPLLFNDLEAAAYAAYPELEEIAAVIQAHGGGRAHLTGSGAAFYLLFDDRASADRCSDEFASHTGLKAYVVHVGAAELPVHKPVA